MLEEAAEIFVIESQLNDRQSNKVDVEFCWQLSTFDNITERAGKLNGYLGV